jgi:hypothetical protein
MPVAFLSGLLCPSDLLWHAHANICDSALTIKETETCPEYAMPLFLLIYLLVCHQPVHYSVPNYLPQDAIQPALGIQSIDTRQSCCVEEGPSPGHLINRACINE